MPFIAAKASQAPWILALISAERSAGRMFAFIATISSTVEPTWLGAHQKNHAGQSAKRAGTRFAEGPGSKPCERGICAMRADSSVAFTDECLTRLRLRVK
mgnify:CR=1 FL=1